MEAAFDDQGVDFAQIIKTYGVPTDAEGQRRYRPMVCTGVENIAVFGAPDLDLVSTSCVERANLSIRMGTRRFTRLTSGFSKKDENHAHAFTLFAMHYNYGHPHQTLTQNAKGVKTTPAMASGLTDRVWGAAEILARTSDDDLLR